MDSFTIKLIGICGILVTGVLFLIFSDENPNYPLRGNEMISVLSNLDYNDFGDERSGGDTHYERVDKSEKYYGAITNIAKNKDDSIQVTFDYHHFVSTNQKYADSNVSDDEEYVVTIYENQTFVAGCKSWDAFRGDDLDTPINHGKSIHVLKYYGIIEKDGIEYYVFHHDSSRISGELECIFPVMIEYSLDVDMDVGMEYSSYPNEMWDQDWY
ncbi:MAG: hypothetical protein OEM28_10245 [Nitrosopumilus sp.]|nr:hypothetical protein [Nitrosopumilus sp.]